MTRVFTSRFWILLLLSVGLQNAPAAVIFSEGFEGNQGLVGWTTGDSDTVGINCWWGIVSSGFGGEGTHGGTNKAYCAASGFSGTTANPLYRDDLLSYLRRSINLSGVSNATLTFWFKLYTEAGYDRARVKVGNTELWSSDSNASQWTLVTLSLNSFVGTVQTLSFEFDSDGSQTFEGFYLDDISIADGPANDNFIAAQLLDGARGGMTNNSARATTEISPNDSGASVWFSWRPRASSRAVFHTEGSSFDTHLCVFFGNSLDGLAEVACDDNSGASGSSRVEFEGTLGNTYLIRLTGVGGASGAYRLFWDQPDVAVTDLLPDLLVWADESQSYLYNPSIDLSEIPGRTLLRLSTATPNIGQGPLELRGSSSSPGVSQRITRSDGSSYDRYAGTFTFHSGHSHLHFDNYMQYYLREILPDGGVGPIVAAGDKTSFAIIDLEHYNAALPGSPRNSFYGGGLVQGLSIGWADVYDRSIMGQWIDVTGVAQGRYWLEAVVDPLNHILEMNESNNASRILFDLVIPPPPPPVFNDYFTNATLLTGLSAGAVGSTVGASSETGERNHYTNNAPQSSIWYKWVAPSSSTVVLSTEGSSFDTVLAVYRGTALANLILIQSNDDSSSGTQSRLTFSAQSGMAYWIAVDGYGSSTGSVQLHVNPALNDNFASALILSSGQGTASGSNRGATRQAGEPIHAGVSGSRSIWYSWTSPISGEAVFHTRGSSFDTLLAVYTGTAVNTLTPVASNNNDGTNSSSRVVYNVTAGTRYAIAVDAISSASNGVVSLAWQTTSLAPGIVVNPVGTNLIAGSSYTFSVGASGMAPLTYQWRFRNTNLTDTGTITGSSSNLLLLGKIYPGQAGSYTVVVRNAYGSVTSAPAHLIVLDNSRVVYFQPSIAGLGGRTRVPIFFQAQGDENNLSGSVLFDPALLLNTRLLVASNAAWSVTVNTNETAQGRLGFSARMPVGQSFASGNQSLAHLIFEVAATLPPTTTSLGFIDQPVAKEAHSVGGADLPVLFTAASLRLEQLEAFGRAEQLMDGRFHLQFHGLGGRWYVVEGSEDLRQWVPLHTNQVDFEAPIRFSDPDFSRYPLRYYRTRLLP